MPTFKFDSASCFLTYPQSDLSIQEVYEFLNSIKPILWARICREQHEDGGYHIHAVAKWTKRHQSKEPRFLDIRGFHPNIQSIRSVKHAIDYVSKDGEFTDYGTVPVSAKRANAGELLTQAGELSEREYWALCYDNKVNYLYAKRFRELEWRGNCETITEDYVPNLSYECTYLVCTSPSPTTTVVVGPTKAGKTSWGKRVIDKPALWVSHPEELRFFDPQLHKAILFDDMSFTHTPITSQIHLTDYDNPRTIHCRYYNARIPAQTQKIFTCNDNPFSEHAAIERRVTRIDLWHVDITNPPTGWLANVVLPPPPMAGPTP